MTVYTIQEAAEKIKQELEYVSQGNKRSQYFTMEYDGEEINIRVADHSGRKANGYFDDQNKTFSFIVEGGWVRHDCNIDTEWEVDENGVVNQGEFMSIEDVLDFELN